MRDTVKTEEYFMERYNEDTAILDERISKYKEVISHPEKYDIEVSVNSSLVNKFCKTNYTCFRGEKDESIVNTIGKRNTIQGI